MNRLLASGLLAIMVAVSLGAIVGFADGDNPMVDFQLASPMAGDHGQYSREIVVASPHGPRTIADEGPAFLFQVVGQERVLDGADTWVTADRFILRDPERDATTLTHEYRFAAGSTQYLGGERDFLWNIEYEEKAPGSGAGHASRIAWRHSMDGNSTLPCGLRNPLQEGIEGPWPSCTLSAGVGPGLIMESHEQVAGAVRGEDEEKAIVVHARMRDRFEEEDTWEMRLWFIEEIPYPVHMELQRDGDDAIHLLRLSHFERGHTPLPTDPGPVSAEPLVVQPRRPWGPSDEGLEHSFPLSKAFSHALEDPTQVELRAYLQEHPDAYVRWALYGESRDNSYGGGMVSSIQYWKLELHDGNEDFRLGVRRIVPDATSDNNIQHIDYYRPSAPWGSNNWYAKYMVDTETVAPPDAVPTAWPTMESMLARGRAIEPDLDEHIGWGFVVHCPKRPCDQADVLYMVESRHEWQRATVQQRESGGYTHQLSLTQDGALVDHRWSSGQRLDSLGAGPSYSGEPQQLEPMESTTPGLDQLWRMPPAMQATSIGVAALLVAAFYWLWPQLKGSLFTLFTRLKPEKLLDHPVRRQLMDLMQANPGMHYQEIRRQLGRSNNVVIHHMWALVQAGLVAEVQGPRYTCYFPAGQMDQPVMRAVPLLKSDGARAVLESVHGRPGITAAEIARRVGIRPPAVSHHVRRLSEAGLMEKVQDGRRMRLNLTSHGREAKRFLGDAAAP